MSAVTHPRAPARRGATRPVSWWGRAWQRAVEESAYAEEDLRAARRLARGGAVGQVTVDAGSYVAAVAEGDDAWTVQGSCETLSAAEWAMFTELVAAVAGRVGALLAGDLPHGLVEDAEESGLELLPYAGDLGSSCGCDAWVDPCRHALAVAHQVGWLLDRDPFVLLHLRGLTRERLLADLHALSAGREDASGGAHGRDRDPDLAAAEDAADRARRALALLEQGQPFDHLF